jgi:arylsulfatase
MSGARNVIFMLADQLRADSVGCYGNAIVQTPNLDKLAAEGTRFDSAFAQHPQCVPSRSSILTGRYPHANGAISNHCAMHEQEVTLPEYLRSAGWDTCATGKVHLFEQKTNASFTEQMLCEGQNSAATDPEVIYPHYKKWIKENGYWDHFLRSYGHHATQEYLDTFQCTVNCIPAEAYFDVWAADQAVTWLENRSSESPFFLFVGFPNPHNPFEPPEPYASLYNPSEMPLPESFHSDLSQKPPHQAKYKVEGRPSNYENLDKESLQRVIAYYYASITMIDDQVGKIMNSLSQYKLMEDTLIVFVSDHGELLGHHGMLQKPKDEYPMLYDVSLRVPLIIRSPSPEASRGHLVEDSIELIDIFPTIVKELGIDSPSELQGQGLNSDLYGEPSPKRSNIFSEIGAVKMLREKDWKLIHYPGQEYGELYALDQDPDEMNNLYSNPDYREQRARLQSILLDRLIGTEASLHGESLRGPAYWRKLTRMA